MAGLAETGLDLRSDDSFLGTSAGARVALHLASGSDLDQLFEQQSKPVLGAPASSPSVDWRRIGTEWARAREAGGPAAILRRVGSLALEVAGTREDRRSIVASQLPVQTWPERSLAMVAVNVETGERRVFDRNSGVELVDAVGPPQPSGARLRCFFEGHHYIEALVARGPMNPAVRAPVAKAGRAQGLRLAKSYAASEITPDSRA